MTTAEPTVEEVARELFGERQIAWLQAECPRTFDALAAFCLRFADRRVREELERAAAVLDMHNAHSAERVRRLAAEHADTEEERSDAR